MLGEHALRVQILYTPEPEYLLAQIVARERVMFDLAADPEEASSHPRRGLLRAGVHPSAPSGARGFRGPGDPLERLSTRF